MGRGSFIEFPLCLLAMNETNYKIADIILSYGLMTYSKKIMPDENIVQVLFDEHKLPNDFTNPLTLKKNSKAFYNSAVALLTAADCMGVTIGGVKSTFGRHNSAENFIDFFTDRYGPQPYCRINKGLCFEARDGKFDFTLFRIQCAISAILGKTKPAARITYNRIRYAMYGFKSEKVYKDISQKESAINKDPFEVNIKIEKDLPSDKVLKNRIELLHKKRFFVKFCYGRRLIYYSTRIKAKKDLIDWVANLKTTKVKQKLNLDDHLGSAAIKAQIQDLIRQSKGVSQKIPDTFDNLIKGADQGL